MHPPDFAFVRHEPVTLAQLDSIGAHNSREMAVPNAWPSHAKGLKPSYKCKGQNLTAAVLEIIKASGARRPYKRQNVGFEVIAAVKRNSGRPLPTEEEFTQKFDEYLAENHGEHLVAARYIHTDEAGIHGHAIVVPITTGPNRGHQAKNPKHGVVVSWNRYSSSESRRHCGLHYFRNHKMAGWQTAWAVKWADQGYRRGIPSGRQHRPIKRIQGQAASIMNMAEEALNQAMQAISLPELSPRDLPRLLTKAGRAEIEAEMREKAREGVTKRMTFFLELAVRGLQLDLEQTSRVELEKRALAAERDAAMQKDAAAAAQARLSPLESRLQASEEKTEKLEIGLQSGEWLRSISDEELNAVQLLAESELEERMEKRRHVRPALRTPKLPGGPEAKAPQR